MREFLGWLWAFFAPVRCDACGKHLGKNYKRCQACAADRKDAQTWAAF
jgi:DNA-directed RNA polymerase subunit N (RpoN/RPB10)